MSIVHECNCPNGMPVTVAIKYHSEDAPHLTQKDGSDWIDLYTAEEVVLKAGEFRLISLGVSMKLPDGYEAHIVPRSSTYKNFGVIQANHMGVIDESYSGDGDVWKFPALAIRPTHIEKGVRICQFRVMKKQPEIFFNVCDHLDGENRGGFGSTGIK